MGTFRVGQKVACIQPVGNNWTDYFGNPEPKNGDILEIDVIDGEYLGFKEFPYIGSDGEREVYHNNMFRPLIDESFGERICAEITEQVKSEELVYD